jgi:hypothetical protein
MCRSEHPHVVRASELRVRRSELRLAVALVAALSLSPAGCGGSAPNRQDVIARGNAICAGTLRAIRAVAPPASGGSSLAELSGYLQEVLPIVEKEVRSIQALPQPAQDRAELDRFIAAEADSGASYRALAAAAAHGDRSGVTEALARLRSAPAPALAAQYGLTACAASGATVR